MLLCMSIISCIHVLEMLLDAFSLMVSEILIFYGFSIGERYKVDGPSFLFVMRMFIPPMVGTPISLLLSPTCGAK